MPWPFDLDAADDPHRTMSDMERQMHRFPWETTSVGPVPSWPAGLKFAVRTLLDCQLPAHLSWGDDCIQFFNDAYTPLLVNKTRALGCDLRETWPEIWPDVAPLFDRVRRGETLGGSGQRLRMNLHGYLEDRYFTYSYSPVYRDDGRPGGVLATFLDTTASTRAERRQALQVALADVLRREAAPLALETAAVRRIAEYFDGARVGYAVIDQASGAAVVQVDVERGDDAGRLDAAVPLGMLCFGLEDSLRAGATVCSADVGADARIADPLCWRTLGIGAGIVVPLMEDGRLEALVFVHEAAPQRWIPDEAGMLEDLAQRIWEAVRRVRAEHLLREETRVLELMKSASETLASTIDFGPLMQAITDAATQLTGAEAGAFFYDGADDNGDACLLHTSSGPRGAAFAGLDAVLAGQPRNAAAAVRSDDIQADPRYGAMAAHLDGGPGQAPLRSWLAAPVVSRAGEPIGWLVFGHAKAAMFGARIEELVGAFAVQAAIAIDNARLYGMAQRSAQERDQLLASERAARSEAERHNKMKDEFLAMLAHELRNPLAPITSAAQLLRLPEVNEGLRLKASNIISRQVRHMTELVDDLLDVSRVTRGLVKLENEILDLNKVAMAAVEQARPHIEERLHALSVELPPDPVPVEGDRTRLIQVLVNLLNNSAKYTPQGGRITIAVVDDGSAAEVCVRDNGSGIDAQLLPHVFDLFTQADRAPDRSQGGLGIGLALVKSIVRMHNGRVAAHSAGAQQGTTMTVTLPLADAEVGQAVRTGEGAGEARPLAVTIVDDNGDAGHSLAVLLRAHGHAVHVYEDASSTLKAAQGADADVFILDIGLPDMTGYELVRRLRRDPRHAGAVYVALTGYGQQRDRELSRQAGFDHHLVKPVEIGKLAQILAAAGERKAAG
ncbi:ATP-binding protein [uncultured Massilia sp.]|uniref:ATP-binding protein n=1 Tax=uncultured Massilia sp. TaxID=169973 RepID=UPI0025D73F64|nr:ATP-binding protein [uncultured Massilia sp.]